MTQLNDFENHTGGFAFCDQLNTRKFQTAIDNFLSLCVCAGKKIIEDTWYFADDAFAVVSTVVVMLFFLEAYPVDLFLNRTVVHHIVDVCLHFFHFFKKCELKKSNFSEKLKKNCILDNTRSQP